jgi:hypothetical protein
MDSEGQYEYTTDGLKRKVNTAGGLWRGEY